MRAFASVSAHFSLHEFFASNPFLSDDQKADMLRASNEARQVYFETGVVERNAMFWPDMTGSEEDVDSREIFDYYFARREKCWPNFSNHLVPFSYEQLLGSHALDCAKFLTAPYLAVYQ